MYSLEEFPSFSSSPRSRGQLARDVILSNRYSIQETIGIGGMGAVYRARDLHFKNAEKLVAVKEMINEARDPVLQHAVIENFEREANILVTLSHPSIPKIYDYFSVDERCYLVLEYIHGRDLDYILENTKKFFSEDQVITWAIELCDVLEYLHQHKPEPIVFRDIKPSNVMINQHNHVVLVDFGIAKHFRTGQKGTMIGTEGYAPPEQYRGEAMPMADLYALGATLHHLVTRRDPRNEPPFSFSERPIRTINPAISPEFETVINKALEYLPENRYQSSAEFKNALQVAAKKTGALYRISPLSDEKTEPSNNIDPIWTFECQDEVRGSPLADRSKVFVGSYDRNIYALDSEDGSILWRFASGGGIISRPTIFDKLVLFGSEDGALYALNRETGTLYWNFKTEAPIRCSPRIAEGHVFFGSDDGHFYAVNLHTQQQIWRIDAGDAIRSSPAISRDGICAGCENGDFLFMDFAGQVRWKYHTKRAITSSPVINQNQIYFTSLDSMVYSLDQKNGWVNWRFQMGKGSISSPCYFHEHLCFGSADGNLYCLQTEDGQETWRFDCGCQVSGSPVFHDGKIYCGLGNGQFVCLDATTGKVIWKYKTEGPITGTPAIENDYVFIGSMDHRLYAFKLK